MRPRCMRHTGDIHASIGLFVLSRSEKRIFMSKLGNKQNDEISSSNIYAKVGLSVIDNLICAQFERTVKI